MADSVGLAPATVSTVINRSPVADSIPKETKDRILAAAKRLNYRPNFFARSFRKQRSFTIGVIVPEVSEAYAALVLGGIEDHLLEAGYFYFVTSHRHRPKLIAGYPELLIDRAVEGLIAVDTPCHNNLRVPVVAVSGHKSIRGVVRIVLDHDRAACLALDHLRQLGHRDIAFIKGQTFSSDTQVRWKAICNAAKQLGLAIQPKLVTQLRGDSPSPQSGYQVSRELLQAGNAFTALFAFNDVSAMGAIRAIREAGLRVPEDVSVIGFDDIQVAAFQNPGLTTVKQPLRKMGEIAAKTVLQRIAAPRMNCPKLITVEPELVIRESTSGSRTLNTTETV